MQLKRVKNDVYILCFYFENIVCVMCMRTSKTSDGNGTNIDIQTLARQKSDVVENPE